MFGFLFQSGILIKDHLIPSLNRKIMAHLQDLQAIPRTKCTVYENLQELSLVFMVNVFSVNGHMITL